MSARIRSTVTNPSTVSRFYAYLNDGLGAWLSPGSSRTFDYDLRSRLSMLDRQALERDIANNRVVYSIEHITNVEIGTVGGPTVRANEFGDRAIHKTVLQLTDTEINLTDAGASGGYGGVKLYDFPEGAIYFIGCVANLTITESTPNIIDNWTGNFAVGTAQATSAGSLTGTRANLIDSTAIPAASGGTSTARGSSTTAQTSTMFDGTTTPVSAFLNMTMPDASISANATVRVNGTVTLIWTLVGDY